MKQKKTSELSPEERANKTMYLAVISQSLIDNLDEEMGEFKFKQKRFAKLFLEETLRVMDKDFQDGNAVDQLINLSVWVQDVYNVMIEIGTRSKIEQQCFQQDWEELLIKYKLS